MYFKINNLKWQYLCNLDTQDGNMRALIFPKVASSASSALVHRTLSGGTPDSPVRQTRVPLGCLLLSLFEPFLGLFIGFF
jgi:hypothetical protein